MLSSALKAMEEYASQFKGKEVTEEEIKEQIMQIFEDWCYGSNSDKHVGIRKIVEYIQSSLSSQFKPKEGQRLVCNSCKQIFNKH